MRRLRRGMLTLTDVVVASSTSLTARIPTGPERRHRLLNLCVRTGSQGLDAAPNTAASLLHAFTLKGRSSSGRRAQPGRAMVRDRHHP